MERHGSNKPVVRTPASTDILGQMAEQLVVHKKAQSVLEPFMVPPWERVFLLDCSASMGGEKIDQMRAGAQECINELPPSDRISLVKFDSSASVLCGSSTDRGEISRLIRSLFPSGSTALTEALTCVERDLPKNARAIIHVVTDGYPDDPESALIVAQRLKENGHVIRCTGVTGANQAFLDQLAGGEQRLVSRVVTSPMLKAAMVADSALPPPLRELPRGRQ